MLNYVCVGIMPVGAENVLDAFQQVEHGRRIRHTAIIPCRRLPLSPSPAAVVLISAGGLLVWAGGPRRGHWLCKNPSPRAAVSK